MQVFLRLGLLLAHLVLLLDSILELLKIFIRWLLIPDDVTPNEATLLRFLRDRDSLVDHLKALWQLRNEVLVQVGWVVRVKSTLLAHEEVAYCLLILYKYLLLALDVGTISVVHTEQILKLILVHKLSGSIFSHEEKSWICN